MARLQFGGAITKAMLGETPDGAMRLVTCGMEGGAVDDLVDALARRFGPGVLAILYAAASAGPAVVAGRSSAAAQGLRGESWQDLTEVLGRALDVAVARTPAIVSPDRAEKTLGGEPCQVFLAGTDTPLEVTLLEPAGERRATVIPPGCAFRLDPIGPDLPAGALWPLMLEYRTYPPTTTQETP